MATFNFREVSEKKRRLLIFRTLSMVALFVGVSTPAVLFALTGIGWISIVVMILIPIVLCRANKMVSKIIKDDYELPKGNNLSSIDARHFVN